MSDLTATLSEAEIDDLTRYRTPMRQAEELRQRGFVLAGVVRGRVWLPREHYNAVCRGAYGKTEITGSWKPDFSRIR